MLRKWWSGAIVAGLVAASVFLGVALPANAKLDPGDALNYMLAVPGQQLYANNTPQAKAAWQGNMNAYAAQSAMRYNAAAILGNVTPERVAGVVPINSVRNPDLPGTPWQRLKSAAGTGFALPFTGTQPGYKPVVGVNGAVVAATAFAFRADISSGVIGLFGVDATGTVCSDDTASSGFVNFMTGQDCTMYNASADFVPNLDAIGKPAGWATAQPCYQSVPCPTGPFMLVLSELQPVQSQILEVGFYQSNPAVAQGSAGLSFWCINTTTNVADTTRTNAPTLSFPARGQNPYATPVGATGFTITCPAGKVLYAVRLGGNPATGSTADAYYATATPTQKQQMWFSAASPNHTPEMTANPERQIECRIHWSTGQITTGLSAVFLETDESFPEPNCPNAPTASSQPSRITLTVIGAGVEPYTYFDQEATEEYEQFVEDNPECLQNACFLDVVVVATGLSCFSSTVIASCVDWFSDADRDTKYACQYGGKSQPMQSCYVYANVFNPDKRAQGLAYVDPLTGEEVPGAVTSTRADEYAMGNPIRPGGAAQPRNCWGGTMSMNPIDWVLRPLQCAAEWAFVPRPSVVDSAVENMSEAWEEKAPGQISTMVSGWNFAPAMTGCRIDFTHWSTGQTMALVDACPGSPVAPLAQISRVVSVLAAVVMASQLIRRQIGGTVDFKGN